MDGLTKSAHGNVPRYISTSEEINYIQYSVHSISSLIQELPSKSENFIDIQTCTSTDNISCSQLVLIPACWEPIVVLWHYWSPEHRGLKTQTVLPRVQDHNFGTPQDSQQQDLVGLSGHQHVSLQKFPLKPSKTNSRWTSIIVVHPTKWRVKDAKNKKKQKNPDSYTWYYYHYYDYDCMWKVKCRLEYPLIFPIIEPHMHSVKIIGHHFLISLLFIGDPGRGNSEPPCSLTLHSGKCDSREGLQGHSQSLSLPFISSCSCVIITSLWEVWEGGKQELSAGVKISRSVVPPSCWLC